jgi:hypothetical protein
MIRNRIFLKAFAVFFILEMVSATVIPTISWALTAGPTAPEATSFEPVDTTDMVNLATGDLAYSIPLLEVPGPSGGYPLSLSYHAGIQPNEESSWVGLGWTLNPGAVVRNVNGFADDQLNQPNFAKSYWDGGETKQYNIGVSVGIAGSAASVSAGLSFSQDTHQGFGVGGNLGFGYGISENKESGNAAQFTMGISPYGDAYGSAGVGIGQKDATRLTTAVGMASSGVYGTVEISRGSTGAGISTNGKQVSASGSSRISFSNNSKSERMKTTSQGFGGALPIGIGSINIGYNYQRYWVNELDNSTVNGALYYPPDSAELDWEYFDDKAFDTYSLLDTDGGIVDNPNPDKVLGGSFPGFDNYLVHAQGVSGSMRPYYFQKHLYKRNGYSINSMGFKVYQTVQYDISKANPGERNFSAEFRFINDFSNRFEFEGGEIENGPSDQTPLQYNFSNGSNLQQGETGSYHYISNQVQGSRNIVWLTNQDILSHSQRAVSTGFIETASTGFNRSTPDATDDNNIGGFVITNESGVKYHFALPAYSYEEYMYSENKSKVETYNEFNKPSKYAYTWYLTAITGTDYVDRGPQGVADGKLNEYDWGYWVEFEYGKWTENYAWRNPSEGMTSDLDQNFKNFSSGKKELYYLDAIRTKTHTALFFKTIKNDGKGSLSFLRDQDISYRGLNSDNVKITTHYRKVIPEMKTGGFIPKNKTCNRKIYYYDENGESEGTLTEEIDYVAYPASTMKLEKIVLIDNESLNAINLSKLLGVQYSKHSNYTYTTEFEQHMSTHEPDLLPEQFDYHLYQNIFDVYDFNNIKNDLNSHALRVINLSTSYSLCAETVNSFDYRVSPPVEGFPSLGSQKGGKLTLDSIKFLGKHQTDLMPKMEFKYEVSNPLRGSAHLSYSNNKYFFTAANSGLLKGDLIRFGSDKVIYAVITDTESGVNVLKILGENTPNVGVIHWHETKNPPYNKDAYDVWGLYKSDFDSTNQLVNESIARSVTDVSSKSLDVWCLRSVKTVMGATIEFDYESDTYSKPVLHNVNSLTVEKVEKLNSTESAVTLAGSFSQMQDVLLPNASLNYMFLFADPFNLSTLQCINVKGVEANISEGEIVIKSINLNNGKWVIKTDSDLQKFYRIKPGLDISSGLCGSNILQYFTPIFVAGNISISGDVLSKGGGIRVKNIIVSTPTKSNKTIYSYNTPTDSQVSSGVTSFAPGGLDNIKFNFPESPDVNSIFFSTSKESLEKIYKKSFYKKFADVLMNSREIPAPGVLYKFVTVSESTKSDGIEYPLDQHTLYEFEVFKRNDVGIQYASDTSYTFPQKQHAGIAYNVYYSKKAFRNVTLKDYTARIGSLKSITLYGKDNKIISKTTNEYLHDQSPDSLQYEGELLARFKNQGVMEETFSDARFVAQGDGVLQGVITKREQYPVIQIGQTTTNYKTGITTSSRNLAFDFYSGQVTHSISNDGYGNSYLTEVIPAYRVYDSMGQTTKGGKNMLIQEAASYSYKLNPSSDTDKVGLVSASIQTWSDGIPALQTPGYALATVAVQPGIWRKRASFSFIGDNTVALSGDGIYPVTNATVPVFSAWSENTTPSVLWQKNAEITLYDVNSHALEATDVNNNFAATKLTLDQTRVLVSCANCKYQELAYSGAEETPQRDEHDHEPLSFGGRVALADGLEVYRQSEFDSVTTHTGAKALKLTSNNQKAFLYSFTTVPNRSYQASVWVNSDAGRLFYTLNGVTIAAPTPSANKKAGAWYLITLDIPKTAQSTTLDVWCATTGATCNFDDFRVHPLNAAVTSYVYNKWGELSHILDNNNLYTEFQYDGLGRLVKTYKETFKYGAKKIAEQKYHYAIQR